MKITKFSGKYNFLSNFHPSPIPFEGDIYPSVEAAYQAAKTLDKEQRKVFTQLANGADAKKAGRKLVLREDWEEVKWTIMLLLCVTKFALHEDLKKKLLDTGTAHLEEGNWWGDTYWGTVDGKGENNLGKILMRVRETLQQAGG